MKSRDQSIFDYQDCGSVPAAATQPEPIQDVWSIGDDELIHRHKNVETEQLLPRLALRLRGIEPT